MSLLLIMQIKFFIALSAATGGVFICSFTSIAGAPVGISSASFTLIVPLTTGIAKKLLLNITRNKKKHDEILMLAKKLVKKNSEQNKYLKEKVINCMSNGKGMITHLIVGLIKKDLV